MRTISLENLQQKYSSIVPPPYGSKAYKALNLPEGYYEFFDANDQNMILDPTNVRFIDWKESGEKVLKHIDDQLRNFGLEIVFGEFDGDAYVWCIDKYQEPVVVKILRQPVDADQLTKKQNALFQFLEKNPGVTDREL